MTKKVKHLLLLSKAPYDSGNLVNNWLKKKRERCAKKHQGSPNPF